MLPCHLKGKRARRMGEEWRSKKIEVGRSRQKTGKWLLGRQKTKNWLLGI